MSQQFEYLRTSPPMHWDRVEKRPEKPKRGALKRLFLGSGNVDLIENLQDVLTASPTADDIQAWLDDHGRQGWELVTQKGDTYTFKRPKAL